MADFKLDPWEREPLWLKLLTPILKKKRFPYLEGTPETGKWYRISCPGCVVATGEPFYADFQKGSENNLMIFFVGGGVAWDEYTVARPNSLYSKKKEEGYYLIRMELVTDIQMTKGIFEESDRNPFRNWSKLVIPYSSGDFHVGTGDFPYTAQDGSQRICHFHGYTNFHTALDQVRPFVATPEKMLVCGCSAGGFGVSMLMDSIVQKFPGCGNLTCMIDSSFFPRKEGWQDVARNVWKAPEEITNVMRSDNLTVDALNALHRKYGSKIKILVACSDYDVDLARLLNLNWNNSYSYSKESGRQYHKWLSDMAHGLRQSIPEAGMFFFHIPDRSRKGMGLTIHTILADPAVIEHKQDGISCLQWMADCVNGKIGIYGLHLLEG